MDCMALALFRLQQFYLQEIQRGHYGQGNYDLHYGLSQTTSLPNLPDQTPPEEIMDESSKISVQQPLWEKAIQKAEVLRTLSSTIVGLTFVSTAFQFQLETTVSRLLSSSSTRRSRPPTIALSQQQTLTLRMFLRRETRTPHSKHTALHLHRPYRLNNSSRLL